MPPKEIIFVNCIFKNENHCWKLKPGGFSPSVYKITTFPSQKFVRIAIIYGGRRIPSAALLLGFSQLQGTTFDEKHLYLNLWSKGK